MPQSPADLTALLVKWSGGDKQALDELMPLVYKELRRIADSFFRRERADHTLQPTALINEAYLRLIDEKNITWQSRAHFIGVAAQLMRFILIDHARARGSAKRGGSSQKVSLDEAVVFFAQKDLDLISLDEALKKLEAIDPQQSRVVELRFFGGLSIEETAVAMDISPATVKREWAMAKAWLHKKLSEQTEQARDSDGRP